ncbi:ribonuclease P protein component [Candidatus Uhrbacteria bacterium]|nr:ribonuclease P protein component [Candidatus Uhrbacteria bacterium]
MLPAAHRLRHEKDIKTLLAKGRSVFGLFMGFRIRKNTLDVSRFAVAVGTKVSKKAVVRNRLRRQIRAILFKHLSAITPGYDFLVMVKKESIGKTSKELETDLVKTLRGRARLLR